MAQTRFNRIQYIYVIISDGSFVGIDGLIAITQNNWSNLLMFTEYEYGCGCCGFAAYQTVIELEKGLQISHLFFSVWKFV